MFGIAAGEGGRDQEAKGIQGQVSFLKPAFPIPRTGRWSLRKLAQEARRSGALFVQCR